ncbi:hypothetical protein E2542_SST04953 [Spatholobus suberectus]|nr:hypothetical protein E2542_SST04953 [Spatholobus suberectus]
MLAILAHQNVTLVMALIVVYNWAVGAGDSILAELLAISIGLKYCWDKGYRTIVCETDCHNAASAINLGMHPSRGKELGTLPSTSNGVVHKRVFWWL